MRNTRYQYPSRLEPAVVPFASIYMLHRGSRHLEHRSPPIAGKKHASRIGIVAAGPARRIASDLVEILACRCEQGVDISS